jgi:hypothetical protein
MDANPNRLNIYTCRVCRRHIVTKDVDKGTTPMLTNCRATFGCQGTMQSSFYNVFDPDGIMGHTHEWYRPTIIDPKWSPAVRHHIDQGGLLLRLVINAASVEMLRANSIFTHRHVKRGTKYRVIEGGVRLQISRSDLMITHENGETSPLESIKDLDGMFFTLYQGEDGVYSARHPAEFSDGRFEEIEQ